MDSPRNLFILLTFFVFSVEVTELNPESSCRQFSYKNTYRRIQYIVYIPSTAIFGSLLEQKIVFQDSR